MAAAPTIGWCEMREVTAYQDNNGDLHKTKKAAVTADFTIMLREVWNSLSTPENTYSSNDKGSSITLAKMFASNQQARNKLIEALDYFEEAMK